MTNEIEYQIENNYYRGHVQRYHGSPNPRNLSKGAKSKDIANLKTADKRNLIDLGNGDYDSKFTIGFEVEKERLSRGAVKEYPLFCGFERDSSCGYEAITNIVPLLPSGLWRNKVFSMMHDARRIIEDKYSPSNYKCGGHVTVACEGLTGQEIMDKVRVNCGIVYALFRKRLDNYYCKRNLFLDDISQRNEPREVHYYHSTRYATVLVKGDCLEFRLVSRFQSVKQMMRRYELFYELLDFSINKPNGSHNAFLKKIYPIIKSMYDGDRDRADYIIDLAKSFRTMIVKRKINRKVIDFVDVRRELDAEMYYDRDLLQNGYRAI
jgi:hypothetical protein